MSGPNLGGGGLPGRGLFLRAASDSAAVGLARLSPVGLQAAPQGKDAETLVVQRVSHARQSPEGGIGAFGMRPDGSW